MGQTADCDYNGRREPKLDQPCYALIYQHQSGYCECDNGIKTALSVCSPKRQPFTCKHMCATEATAEPGPYGGADTSITLNSPGICTPTHIPVELDRRQHNSIATGAGDGYASTVLTESGAMVLRNCVNSFISNPGSWCAYSNTPGTWYILETGRTQLIVGIVTKGRGDTDQWVTSYTADTIHREGDPFVPVTNSSNNITAGERHVFRANFDRDTAVTNYFEHPIKAFLVKITPLTWHRHISLRIELLGCRNEVSRCGDIIGAGECQQWLAPSGGSYYFSPRVASDDKLAKVHEWKGGKAISYPDDDGSGVYGSRGVPPSVGTEMFIGRGVTLDQCAAACDATPSCTAFSLLDAPEPIGQCWLQRDLDHSALDWKPFGVAWTTYRKATSAETNAYSPPTDRYPPRV